MRAVSIIKGVLLNVCVICSIVCIVLKILDWYNPYMDFTGHGIFAAYILYVSVFLYTVLEYLYSAKAAGRRKNNRET